jgi:hypothetical protein
MNLVKMFVPLSSESLVFNIPHLVTYYPKLSYIFYISCHFIFLIYFIP